MDKVLKYGEVSNKDLKHGNIERHGYDHLYQRYVLEDKEDYEALKASDSFGHDLGDADQEILSILERKDVVYLTDCVGVTNKPNVEVGYPTDIIRFQ